jgi:CDP-glycerol glycerophosphotransferase (TagB/SpsB family)
MNIFRFIKLIFLHVMWMLSRLFPRDRKVWVFGSGQRFAGNSRWLFLHVAEIKDIQAVWVSTNRNVIKELRMKRYRAYSLCSLKGIFYALRAGVYIFNINIHSDIFLFLSSGAKKINLWHGIPVKKGGYDVDIKGNYFYELYRGNVWKKISRYFSFPWEYDRCDVVISTSEKTKKLMEGIFGSRAKTVEALGYPCQDYIKNVYRFMLSSEKTLIDRFQEMKDRNRRIFLYMPTYRDAAVHEGAAMHISMDWAALQQFLEKENAVFILKLHPIDRSDYSFLQSFSRIVLIDPTLEANVLFPYVDCLVTDYSSVFYDFMLTDKPIVFYCYDLNEYVAKNRTLYADLFDNLPGPMVKDFPSLLDALKNEKLSANYAAVKKDILTFTDGGNAKRVGEYLLKDIV